MVDSGDGAVSGRADDLKGQIQVSSAAPAAPVNP